MSPPVSFSNYLLCYCEFVCFSVNKNGNLERIVCLSCKKKKKRKRFWFSIGSRKTLRENKVYFVNVQHKRCSKQKQKQSLSHTWGFSEMLTRVV